MPDHLDDIDLGDAQAPMLERLRALGLTMGGSFPAFTSVVEDGESGTLVDVTTRLRVGWTTSKEKADAAALAGAHVMSYVSREPQFNGWDISFREVVDV